MTSRIDPYSMKILRDFHLADCDCFLSFQACENQFLRLDWGNWLKFPLGTIFAVLFFKQRDMNKEGIFSTFITLIEKKSILYNSFEIFFILLFYFLLELSTYQPQTSQKLTPQNQSATWHLKNYDPLATESCPNINLNRLKKNRQ